MRRLRTAAEVRARSDDTLVRWAAQALRKGGTAWEHDGAVGVLAPSLNRRRRLVLSGNPEGMATLLAAHGRGESLRPLVDRRTVPEVLTYYPELVEDAPFGWMERTGTLDTPPGVRWLSDDAAVTELLNKALPTSWAWPGEPGVERWAGIEDDGRLVATACSAWSSDDVGFLMGVGVDPAHTGKGLGRRICTFVVSHLLRTHGTCALMVEKDNARAISLYRTLGFRYRDVTTLLPAV